MSTTLNNSSVWQTKLLWIAVAVLGAVAFAIVALNRGEAVNAAWLVTAAVCIYFIAFRFYGRFVADRALGVDGARPTPAYRHNDGLDYVPTNQYVLFGHHFAAIAGAGPLVGPVLAAQMGYLPGTRGSSPARCSLALSRIVAFVWLDPGITPCCKTPFAQLIAKLGTLTELPLGRPFVPACDETCGDGRAENSPAAKAAARKTIIETSHPRS